MGPFFERTHLGTGTLLISVNYGFTARPGPGLREHLPGGAGSLGPGPPGCDRGPRKDRRERREQVWPPQIQRRQ